MNISKIINGLRYDTATATEICSFESSVSQADFQYEETWLYKTPRGQFFLAGRGGAMTRWAQPVQDGRSGGRGLVPVGVEEARAFAEDHAGEEIVAQFFEIEEA
ncbi:MULTISPECIES: hypothetical protein [Rhizobium]|uniref:hypothetical protein n=1 Tax=Rhizobium TaxID=379 RepID=UPI00102F3208|nr:MULTISPECIES: hypothetical protein [Rhizobium]MBY5826314.1 hypothetical protein [Rhizobium leguminosarum]TBA44974.1 hypothetical protein ELH62_22520 [Rhizobium ruizarguesonis]